MSSESAKSKQQPRAEIERPEPAAPQEARQLRDLRELLGQLEWDQDFDYKSERSRR